MFAIARDRLHIFHYRPYRFYFTGTTCSYLGNGMQFIANSWLALSITGANYAVALVLIFSALPGILFSPLIGIYIDRLDRRILAACTDLFRAIVMFVVFVILLNNQLQAWHLYLMAFLIATGDQVFIPTTMALIREVLPKEMLLSANATSGAAIQLGSLLGAMLGGIIIALISPAAVILINACSYLISATCIFCMRDGFCPSTIAAGKTKGWGDFFRQMTQGWTYIHSHLDIVPRYLMLLLFTTTLRMINASLAPFATNVLHVGVKGYGYIDAMFGVGAIIGGILLPLVVRPFGEKRCMITGVLMLGGSLLVFAFSPNLLIAMGGYLFVGLAFQVQVLYLTSVQQRIDLNYQGRVHTTFTTFFSIITLLVYVVAGYLQEIVSQRALYVFQGCLLLLGAAYVFSFFSKHKDLVIENKQPSLPFS